MISSSSFSWARASRRLHSVFRFPVRAAALSAATALAALTAVACGSTSPAPSDGVGPDGIPDARALPTLRNDCFEVAGKGLPSNVGDSTGDGPISRFRLRGDGAGWSPIVGTSRESLTSMSVIDKSWTASSSRAPHAACSALMPIFARASQGEGRDEVRYAMNLEHTVVDFAYPKDLASAPAVDTPIPVKVTSALRIDYERPFLRRDGTLDPDLWTTAEGDAQTWPLETTCEKPFTVTPRWEAQSSLPSVGAQFCRASASDAVECLTFKLDYVGDACSFVARDATIKLPAGGSVHATFAGFFERATGAIATGYSLRVTNIEIR